MRLRQGLVIAGVAIVVGMTVVLAAVALRDGGAPASTGVGPRHDGPGYSFERPDAWSRRQASELSVTTRDVEYVAAGQGALPQLIGVEREDGVTTEVDGYARLYFLSGREAFRDFEFRQQPFDVAGADEATLATISYIDDTTGEDVPVELLAVIAKSGDEIVNLQVGGASATFDQRLAQAIATSLALE